MQEQYAKVVAHSRSVYSKNIAEDLISIETYTPKFLDAEFEKHCAIASNSSSDRATPMSLTLTMDPYIPMDIRKPQAGMQGNERIDSGVLHDFTNSMKALHEYICEVLSDYSKFIHKQHLNRYLLPFSMQKKLMTATRAQWDYFLNLRLHEDADPNIYIAAELISSIIKNSIPKILEPTQWHTPYLDDGKERFEDLETMLKSSAARSARVSYLSFEGKEPDITKDLATFDKLAKSDPKHESPLDHQAMYISKPNKYAISDCFLGNKPFPRGVTHVNTQGEFCSGKLNNWICYRHYSRYEK